MKITLKYEELCSVLWSVSSKGPERIEDISNYIKTTYSRKVDKTGISKIENFLKLFDVKSKSVDGNQKKFRLKFCSWMETTTEISTYNTSAGAPCKSYEDLCSRSKKRGSHKNFFQSQMRKLLIHLTKC